MKKMMLVVAMIMLGVFNSQAVDVYTISMSYQELVNKSMTSYEYLDMDKYNYTGYLYSDTITDENALSNRCELVLARKIGNYKFIKSYHGVITSYQRMGINGMKIITNIQCTDYCEEYPSFNLFGIGTLKITDNAHTITYETGSVFDIGEFTYVLGKFSMRYNKTLSSSANKVEDVRDYLIKTYGKNIILE